MGRAAVNLTHQSMNLLTRGDDAAPVDTAVDLPFDDEFSAGADAAAELAYYVIAPAPAAEMLAASTMIYSPPASHVRDAQLADPRDHCDGPALRSLGPSAASSLGPLASLGPTASLGPSASLGPLASPLGSRAI